MPQRVGDLLYCWAAITVKKDRLPVWRAVPSCLTWICWRKGICGCLKTKNPQFSFLSFGFWALFYCGIGLVLLPMSFPQIYCRCWMVSYYADFYFLFMSALFCSILPVYCTPFFHLLMNFYFLLIKKRKEGEKAVGGGWGWGPIASFVHK